MTKARGEKMKIFLDPLDLLHLLKETKSRAPCLHGTRIARAFKRTGSALKVCICFKNPGDLSASCAGFESIAAGLGLADPEGL